VPVILMTLDPPPP